MTTLILFDSLIFALLCLMTYIVLFHIKCFSYLWFAKITPLLVMNVAY